MLDQHFIVVLEVMFVLNQTFVERATNIAIQHYWPGVLANSSFVTFSRGLGVMFY